MSLEAGPLVPIDPSWFALAPDPPEFEAFELNELFAHSEGRTRALDTLDVFTYLRAASESEKNSGLESVLAGAAGVIAPDGLAQFPGLESQTYEELGIGFTPAATTHLADVHQASGGIAASLPGAEKELPAEVWLPVPPPIYPEVQDPVPEPQDCPPHWIMIDPHTCIPHP